EMDNLLFVSIFRCAFLGDKYRKAVPKVNAKKIFKLLARKVKVCYNRYNYRLLCRRDGCFCGGNEEL
ncbi:MAG: hypothetical protein IKM27_04165, partial [Clostridia bacterium]|nr:hypothetical protein [Clostridia bacterium]